MIERTSVDGFRTDEILARLQRSAFRRRFRLGPRDRRYLTGKGIETVMQHAQAFIDERLAPALPRNDGRQTPMRGHPVFVAQHATATCCRGCLDKWHTISPGQPLTESDKVYILTVLQAWLERQPIGVAVRDDDKGDLLLPLPPC